MKKRELEWEVRQERGTAGLHLNIVNLKDSGQEI